MPEKIREIRDIRTSSKGMTLVLSDEESLNLNEDVFSDFYLYPGKRLSEEEYLRLKEEIRSADDFDYAKKLLSKRPYSCRDLREKLLKIRGCDASAADRIIDRLKELHLLDDASYAADYIFFQEQKGYGYDRICMELKEKGIPADTVPYRYDRSKELENATRHLEQMLRRYGAYPFHKMKDALRNAYRGMGFREDVIGEVLKQIEEAEWKAQDQEKLLRDFTRLTCRMDREEIRIRKQSIVDKLMRKGYSFHDIIEMMEGIEDGKIY